LLVGALVLPPAWAGGRVDPGLHRPASRAPGKSPYPILGKANAPVTVMVFADLQCPFSRRLYERVLQRVVKEYAGRVRVVWRDFPLRFHKGARPASLAAREVYRQKGHAAFFEFISLVFKNYRSISTTSLAGWAQQVGADPAKVRAAVMGKLQNKRINADIAAGKSAGVSGTPHAFVFRGKLTATALSSARSVRGAQKYPKVKRIIDAMLGK
jgi:protein-disulfide isomerase